MDDNLTSRQAFVFACTSIAARCERRGLAAQASTFLQIAALAIQSPQDDPPIHHYAPDLLEATYHAYGVVGVDASMSLIEEALPVWQWLTEIVENSRFRDCLSFVVSGNYDGAYPDRVSEALAIWRAKGVGYRAELRRSLAAPFEGGFKFGAPAWTKAAA